MTHPIQSAVQRVRPSRQFGRCPRWWLMAAAFALAPLLATAAEDPTVTSSPPAASAVSAGAVSSAAVDPELQKALDYRLPANECTAPVNRKSNQNAGAVEKQQRAQKRYAECVGKYQAGLLADLQTMTATAKRALAAKQLTNPQGDTIKHHMETIAATIKSLRGG